MGYSILYNKQFIKAEDDRIIPMLYIGSSNCYEYTGNGNRMRRARDWNLMHRRGAKRIDVKPTQLLKMWGDISSNQVIKYNGRWLDGKAYYKLLQKALKEALPIEEIVEKPMARIVEYETNEDNWLRPKQIGETQCLRTTEDVVKFARLYDKVRRTHKDAFVDIDFLNADQKLTHQRQGTRNRKSRPLGNYWVLEYQNGVFVKKLSSRRLFWTSQQEAAKYFTTEKAAQQWLEKYAITFRFRLPQVPRPVYVA